LTTHFGTNFSGGSTATCEIFSRIEKSFDGIVVIGTKLGDHPFASVKFTKYRNWFHAVKILKAFKKEKVIFYGDFYNSFLYIMAGIDFYFTYHDNWPEQGMLGFKSRILSLFYTNIYLLIFKHAEFVVTVSNFKNEYISKYTHNSKVINIGFSNSYKPQKKGIENQERSILMVGNIDERKYKLAVPLFKKISALGTVQIDIYGHIVNNRLAKKLINFPFVHLKGHVPLVPYSLYKVLLHTSFSESFGMVFCEAIYHGVPVVAFNVGGAKEVIGEQNGWLVEPYNIDDMISKIEKGLKDNLQVNRESLNQYSWDAASSSYLKTLEV